MQKTTSSKLSFLLSNAKLFRKESKPTTTYREYSEFEEQLAQTSPETQQLIEKNLDKLVETLGKEQTPDIVQKSYDLSRQILALMGYDLGTMDEVDVNFGIKCGEAYLSSRLKYISTGPLYNDWKKEGHHSLDYGVIPWQLNATSKVAIIGDWGTGLPDAELLLTNIIENEKPDAIIHLGDIYYSGTIEEAKLYFLNVFKRVFAATKHQCRIFNLAGNHDYYSFGEGFYEILPHLNAAILHTDGRNSTQQASYFNLKTKGGNWQIMGIDTGYNDGNPFRTLFTGLGPDIQASEKEWVNHHLNAHAGKTILLSHHQLFSAHEKLSNGEHPYLNTHLDKLFRPHFPKIAAWFWGHEHSLALFEENLLGLKKGRLVGCSAFQDDVDEDNKDAYFNCYPHSIRYMYAPKEYEKYKLRNGCKFYFHGYTIINFEDENATARYYDYPNGNHIAANYPKVRRLIYEEKL